MTRYERVMCVITVSIAALCWPFVINKAIMWAIYLIEQLKGG